MHRRSSSTCDSTFFQTKSRGNVSIETLRNSWAIQFASGNAFIATNSCIFDEHWTDICHCEVGRPQKLNSNLIRNKMWIKKMARNCAVGGCERNSTKIYMLIMQRRHSLYKWMRPCEQQLHAIRARGTNNNHPTTFLLRQRCGHPSCVALVLSTEQY